MKDFTHCFCLRPVLANSELVSFLCQKFSWLDCSVSINIPGFPCVISILFLFAQTLLPSIVNVVAQLLTLLLISAIQFLFSPYSVLYAYTSSYIHMCISRIDKLFLSTSLLMTGQSACSRTEVFPAPLWLYLDFWFVVKCHAILGIIYQLLTKSWCV